MAVGEVGVEGATDPSSSSLIAPGGSVVSALDLDLLPLGVGGTDGPDAMPWAIPASNSAMAVPVNVSRFGSTRNQ